MDGESDGVAVEVHETMMVGGKGGSGGEGRREKRERDRREENKKLIKTISAALEYQMRVQIDDDEMVVGKTRRENPKSKEKIESEKMNAGDGNNGSSVGHALTCTFD